MVTVSLCMIVRNEEEVLGRCLECVKDAVDEIVIVDTGSLDRTKEIAEKYTDRIYDFPWQDDFAAARNFSFSKAGMEYCMWLDADDVMDEKNVEKFSAWKQGADGSADVVMMPYVTAVDEKGGPVFSYYRERLVKRVRDFQWEGYVHEAIAAAGKTEYLEAVAEHRKEKPGDGDRNLRIYEGLLKRGKELNGRETYYFARELFYHNRYGEAVENFKKFLSFSDSFVENRVDACKMAAYGCYALGDEETALDYLLQGLKYRVPGAELCCDLGKHFYDREQWETAAFWYQAALHAPRKEKAGGFVMEECYGYLPCLQLSVCWSRLGDMKQAVKWHKRAGKCKPYGKEYLENRSFFAPYEEKIPDCD